jgi:predicted PurR-regulated permease PerM
MGALTTTLANTIQQKTQSVLVRAWWAIRWRILLILILFGVLSTFLISALSERITEWASGVEQFDDTTILVLALE